MCRSRCDAVLLPSHEVVPLSTTFVEASEQVQALQGIRPGGGLSAYAAAQDAVVSALEFTWHKIMRPVLDRMPGDRVWWCPTGPASLLPLHAAGDYRGTGESALDRVVSSYAPTLSSLSSNEDEESGRGMLVVGAGDLPGVADEIAAVMTRFPFVRRWSAPTPRWNGCVTRSAGTAVCTSRVTAGRISECRLISRSCRPARPPPRQACRMSRFTWQRPCGSRASER